MNTNKQKYFDLSFIYLPVIITITIFYFSLTYLGSYTNIMIVDVFLIIFLICLISLIEYSLIKYSFIQIFSKKLTLSLVIFFNIYAVNLVYSDEFIKQSFYTELGLMAFGIFIAYALINILNDYKKFQNIFVSVLLIISITIFFTPSFYQATSKGLNVSELSNFKIMPITFKKKPNVYIIGIDALVPQSLLEKHLQIETTDLHKILYRDFISYKNMFSGGTRTVPSYLTMLSLTPEYWHSYENNENCRFCPTKMNRSNLFNGLTPSPLLLIFKSNGYETTTGHEWPHFGKDKGPFVDNYLLRTRQDGKRIDHSVCDLTSPRSSIVGFFGYCKMRGMLPLVKRHTTTTQSLHYKGFSYNFAWDLRNIEMVSKKNRPQLYIGHILSPRHTSYDFNLTNKSDFEEFKKFYIEACNHVAKLLQIALNHISENDPDAIMFVWGDHGPILSQHLTWDKRFDASSKHKLVKSTIFFGQDRFGVYGGVHNVGSCAKTSFQNKRIYNTPQHVLRDILHCLSDEESIQKNHDYFQNFKNEESFPMPRKGEYKTNPNDKIVYREFLYE